MDGVVRRGGGCWKGIEGEYVGTNRMEKSTLTGQNRQVLFITSENIHPFGVAVYHVSIDLWSVWWGGEEVLVGEGYMMEPIEWRNLH